MEDFRPVEPIERQDQRDGSACQRQQLHEAAERIDHERALEQTLWRIRLPDDGGGGDGKHEHGEPADQTAAANLLLVPRP